MSTDQDRALDKAYWEKDFNDNRREIDSYLDRLLPSADAVPQVLHEAMRYSVMAGGKRLRPVLAVYTYTMTGKNIEGVIRPACALEYIHTYSLIHDDLPCMDDDDLRRGQPTLHKKFGEAIAVLAGDALHAYAFELLAKSNNSGLVGEVAHAIGTGGMLGGQVCDILAENKDVRLEDVEHIHRNKTGALIAVSLRVGALLAEYPDKDLDIITSFGEKIGLAFQIIDDVLDCIGDEELLGKTVGKDDFIGKATYPRVVGLNESRRIARELISSAVMDLERLSYPSEPLRYLAELILSRQN